VSLLVLDDVWNVSDAAPFLNALGPRCRLLVTTRDGTIATTISAQAQRLDVLGNEAAMALLADWSEQPVEKLPTHA